MPPVVSPQFGGAGWASCSRGRRGNSIPSPARRETSSSDAPGRRAAWCHYPLLTSEETRAQRGEKASRKPLGPQWCSRGRRRRCLLAPWTVRVITSGAQVGEELSSLSAHFACPLQTLIHVQTVTTSVHPACLVSVTPAASSSV